MKSSISTLFHRVGLGLALLLAFAPASQASVEVAVDATTISEFLGAVMPDRIDVPVAGTTVPVRIKDFQVLGFTQASAGTNVKGYIDTALVVSSVDYGLSLTLRPKLSVRVVERNGFRMCELRFEKVPFSIPLVGSANLAPMFPPVVLPADYLSQVPTGGRDVPVRTRLSDVTMGRDSVRMHFDLIVNPDVSGLLRGR
ncbi:hypothetical protein ABI59_11860 [Acidobacteria bacterium Mor1]|nr:hypothetical protein ABI59_11860 [Acidobacteria bacterium Mor1]